jgi:hypothetical protein
MDKIAEQAVLVFLNQMVEQIRVAASQSPRDLSVFIGHRVHEIAGSRVHATHPYANAAKKDA